MKTGGKNRDEKIKICRIDPGIRIDLLNIFRS